MKNIIAILLFGLTSASAFATVCDALPKTNKPDFAGAIEGHVSSISIATTSNQTNFRLAEIDRGSQKDKWLRLNQGNDTDVGRTQTSLLMQALAGNFTVYLTCTTNSVNGVVISP